MPLFQRATGKGEDVICVLKTTNSSGVYTSATVSTKVQIEDPSGNVVVAWTDMTEESEGVFVYAYDINLDADNGTYTANYYTVNTADSLKTLSKWTFDVEAL